MHLRLYHVKAAHIDAIKAKQWQRRGVAAGRPSSRQFERFDQIKPFNQNTARHFTPIIEVPGNDQGRMWGYQLLNTLFQCQQLLRLTTLEQSQVNTYAVQIFWPAGNTDFAMKQATTFKTVCGNIFIVPTRNGITAQNRIAVMPFIVYRIFSIGKIGPDRVSQKLMLRPVRPIIETGGVPSMLADHFLQKDNIGTKSPQIIAQLVNHHVPLEMGKTFVNIVGSDMQLIGHVMEQQG